MSTFLLLQFPPGMLHIAFYSTLKDFISSGIGTRPESGCLSIENSVVSGAPWRMIPRVPEYKSL